MPARDLLHPSVRRALEKDGWEITDDPLRLVVGTSEIADMETALGQFSLYERVLRKNQPDRSLWLAVPSRVWAGLFHEALGELLLEAGDLRILVVNPHQEVIERWIPSAPGVTSSSAS